MHCLLHASSRARQSTCNFLFFLFLFLAVFHKENIMLYWPYMLFPFLANSRHALNDLLGFLTFCMAMHACMQELSSVAVLYAVLTVALCFELMHTCPLNCNPSVIIWPNTCICLDGIHVCCSSESNHTSLESCHKL